MKWSWWITKKTPDSYVGCGLKNEIQQMIRLGFAHVLSLNQRTILALWEILLTNATFGSIQPTATKPNKRATSMILR